VCSDPWVCVLIELVEQTPDVMLGVSPQERRAFARIPAAELAWIREVRLKYGPHVSLVDLSPGGALLRTRVQLRPGTVQVLEIVGPEIETIPFRVVRCHVAQIGEEGAIYQGACEFKRNIELATARARSAPGLVRVDLALRQLLFRQRESLALKNTGGSPHVVPALPGLLRSIQAAAFVNDPLGRGVCDVLSELVPALDRGEPAAVLRSRLEQLLRRAMPNLDIAVAGAPLAGGPGKESIYFAAGDHAAPQGVLNVQLPDGCALADWQFRLLQASSYLLELLSSAGTGLDTGRAQRGAKLVAEAEAVRERVQAAPAAEEPPAETPRAWQKIVVRYREGRLLKGYTHDFHPMRAQFSLWPSINAAPNERIVIPLSHLKAVFFVRDFNGDPGYVDRQVFDGAHAGGRRLEVMFADGEVMVGSTLSYRHDGVGFFLTPADRRVNNRRVFVVASALRHVRFL
jgi:hypothetical protein